MINCGICGKHIDFVLSDPSHLTVLADIDPGDRSSAIAYEHYVKVGFVAWAAAGVAFCILWVVM